MRLPVKLGLAQVGISKLLETNELYLARVEKLLKGRLLGSSPFFFFCTRCTLADEQCASVFYSFLVNDLSSKGALNQTVTSYCYLLGLQSKLAGKTSSGEKKLIHWFCVI